MSQEVALFLCALIRQEKYRYNYGRKRKLEVMKMSTLQLPVTDVRIPDSQQIEKIIRSCPAWSLLSSATTAEGAIVALS